MLFCSDALHHPGKDRFIIFSRVPEKFRRKHGGEMKFSGQISHQIQLGDLRRMKPFHHIIRHSPEQDE